jgi:hypothetical protein
MDAQFPVFLEGVGGKSHNWNVRSCGFFHLPNPSCGMDSFLVKPVAVGTLRAEITRYAEKLQKPADNEERARLGRIETEKLPA